MLETLTAPLSALFGDLLANAAPCCITNRNNTTDTGLVKDIAFPVDYGAKRLAYAKKVTSLLTIVRADNESCWRLLAVGYSNGEYIATSAMKHGVAGRAEDKCQAMTPVTANNNQINIGLLGQIMHFLSRMP